MDQVKAQALLRMYERGWTHSELARHSGLTVEIVHEMIEAAFCQQDQLNGHGRRLALGRQRPLDGESERPFPRRDTKLPLIGAGIPRNRVVPDQEPAPDQSVTAAYDRRMALPVIPVRPAPLSPAPASQRLRGALCAKGFSMMGGRIR